jgi:acyl transferase domain-containing protein
MAARHGHFIHDAGSFDAEYFRLSPREALNTDPQQRLLLEVVVDALDDAGFKAADAGGEKSWNREKMGVFVGCSDVGYQQ